jgi:hypothetical protein
MTPSIQRQRGEGKIGCIVTLLVFSLILAASFKLVPVYWNNNEFKSAAKDIASRASVMAPPAIELQIKAKAKELNIPEALAPGAISIAKIGDGTQGDCKVTLRYSQKIDFYGLLEYNLETDTVLSTPYLNAAN